MKFDRNEIDGKITYFLFGIDDISTAGGCVCRYRQGELQEAIEHADVRDGIVVSADWTGFVAVEHVASSIQPEEIAQRAIEGKPSEEALWMAKGALTFIRVNSPDGSRRQQQAVDMQTMATIMFTSFPWPKRPRLSWSNWRPEFLSADLSAADKKNFQEI